jgi:tetratricopeptide (TPR) repeat protein
MELIQQMLKEASQYDALGQKQEALERYSDTFNLLIAEAAEFARSESGAPDDEDVLRAMAPRVLQYAKEYLVRDLTVATILNAMGVLFEELGEFDNAKQKFQESIEYTPVGVTYDEPGEHLDQLSSRVIKDIELESSDEE